MRTILSLLGIFLLVFGGYFFFLSTLEEEAVSDTELNPNLTPAEATITTKEDPLEKIGQLFMIGHWADRPVASTTELVREYGIGGVIIMSAPENPEDIIRWVKEWQSVSSSSLLIAIDQEGGPVSRLKGPDFIATGQRTISETETAFSVGKTRGEELASLGINLNFAPVLDTAKNSDSFMYTRVFPERSQSALLASAMINGMAESKVIGAIKHFPGHDDTTEDSHAQLPTVLIDENEVDDFVFPFRELIQTHPPQALMTAHVAFPAIDPLPATLSKFWLTTYLRDTLGYKGVVITDDMIMDAIDQSWPHEEATIMALTAGADIILYAAEPEKVGEAIRAVQAAEKAGRLPQDQLEESLIRINNLLTYIK